jgi:hypothetical protein
MPRKPKTLREQLYKTVKKLEFENDLLDFARAASESLLRPETSSKPKHKMTLTEHRQLMLDRVLKIQLEHPQPESFESLIAWLKSKLEKRVKAVKKN